MTGPLGNVHFEPDPDRPGASILVIGGAAQSCVDPADPYFIGLEAERRVADVFDLAAPPGAPLRVVHLGGGALSLPRYLAATRPGSESIVFELHRGVLAAVRWLLGSEPAPGVQVQHSEARAGLEGCASEWADIVVNDASVGRVAPAHLGTAELLAEARRVLRPGGVYANNFIDDDSLATARARAATVLEAFTEVAAFGKPGVLEGRRGSNLLLVAADRALPFAGLAERAAANEPPWSAADRGGVEAFAAGATVLRDGAAG